MDVVRFEKWWAQRADTLRVRSGVCSFCRRWIVLTAPPLSTQCPGLIRRRIEITDDNEGHIDRAKVGNPSAFGLVESNSFNGRIKNSLCVRNENAWRIDYILRSLTAFFPRRQDRQPNFDGLASRNVRRDSDFTDELAMVYWE